MNNENNLHSGTKLLAMRVSFRILFWIQAIHPRTHLPKTPTHTPKQQLRVETEGITVFKMKRASPGHCIRQSLQGVFFLVL